MTPLDHTTALWADGAALMAWLDEVAVVPAATATVRKRIDRWRGGAQASFWHVDELMVSVGLHVSEAPREVWRAYDNGRRRRPAALVVV
jgi:hypothetical protein